MVEWALTTQLVIFAFDEFDKRISSWSPGLFLCSFAFDPGSYPGGPPHVAGRAFLSWLGMDRDPGFGFLWGFCYS